jgi:hypothetical protein
MPPQYIGLFFTRGARKASEGKSMATDSNFSAIGGGNVSTGILGWAIPGGPANFPLQIGVWGLGSQRGVLGMIDDGTLTPGSGLPTGASYIDSSAILGAAPKTTGVGGVSATGVGVFGQAGPFAVSLPAGVSCGVLGTATGEAGVIGFSEEEPGVMGLSEQGSGVSGRASGVGNGVEGTSTFGFGVVGASPNVAVRGQSGNSGPPLVDPQHPKPDTVVGVGVFGSGFKAIGVGGTSQMSIGVLGQTGGKAPAFDVKTTYTAGVVGTSRDATGVIGFSQNNIGVLGVLGAGGPAVPVTQKPYAGVAGVRGTSDPMAGVVGTSNASYGVYGFSTTYHGVVGEIPATSAAYAGVFLGRVLINGDLTVAGAFNMKGCAVPFPDGTHRVLYCMESPEVWFEDFGSARLKLGRTVVKLDADFAKVIKRGDYHVFLTPRGDCRGLGVRRQGGASFEVRELMGGKSNVAFSYRIVGRRKDVKDRKRFPKLDVTPTIPPGRRTARTRSALSTLLAKARKQAGARPGRARRRKTARAPLSLSTLLAKTRKQAGAKAARRRKRAKKRA